MSRPKSFDEHETLGRIGELFWEQGFAATAIDQICALVALKKTSIYNAYGDKANLFRKVVDWYITDMLTQAGEFLRGTAPVSQELAELIRHFTVVPEQDVVSRGCLITNAMLELRHSEPELYDYVRERFQRVPDALTAYLAAAQQAGTLDENTEPAELSAFVMTVFQGMRVQPRVHNVMAHRERIIELAMAPIKAVERQSRNSTH